MAVTWGSRQGDLEISRRCNQILTAWRIRKDEGALRDLLAAVDGDFDRFINVFTRSSQPDQELFAKAANSGRAFDKLLTRNSLPSLTMNRERPATPFHGFSSYSQDQQPIVLRKLPESNLDQSKIYLARCEKVDNKSLYNSVVVCDGNVRLGECLGCLIIASGNVQCEKALITSMIFAGGDCTLGPDVATSTHGLIIASGKVSIAARVSSLLVITPMKVDLASKINVGKQVLFFDGKSKPVSELFTFRDLWADYGLDASLHQGRVKISKGKADSPFSQLVKQGDIILAHDKTKIESVGHFRRLLRLALDTGEFKFDIEREGKKMNLRADLKKK
jgi:hypothetical protein